MGQPVLPAVIPGFAKLNPDQPPQIIPRTRPIPILDGTTQPRAYRIQLHISHRTGELFTIANSVIVGFVLPECSAAIEDRIGPSRGCAFEPFHDP